MFGQAAESLVPKKNFYSFKGVTKQNQQRAWAKPAGTSINGDDRRLRNWGRRGINNEKSWNWVIWSKGVLILDDILF